MSSKQLSTDIYVVEDKDLRRGLTDACLKIEEMIASGKKTIGTDISVPIKLGPMACGIKGIISTERPAENKPIIYRISFVANMTELQAWSDAHKNMMGTNMLVFKHSMGLILSINQKAEESFCRVDISGGSKDNVLINLSESINFIVHRELINPHEWFIQVAL